MTQYIGFVGTDDWMESTPEMRVFLLRDAHTWSLEERLSIMGIVMPGGRHTFESDIEFARRLIHGPHAQVVRRRAAEQARKDVELHFYNFDDGGFARYYWRASEEFL